MKVFIKPLSVNEAWRGRKYKTPKYKQYERDLLISLPKKFKEDYTELYIKIGVSSLFDIDNCLKPLIDVLQKKYGFNDRYIKKLVVEKEIVKKGGEYIEIK
jgi:Holliday junction resolvase RusA-like endonuclease